MVKVPLSLWFLLQMHSLRATTFAMKWSFTGKCSISRYYTRKIGQPGSTIPMFINKQNRFEISAWMFARRQAWTGHLPGTNINIANMPETMRWIRVFISHFWLSANFYTYFTKKNRLHSVWHDEVYIHNL